MILSRKIAEAIVKDNIKIDDVVEVLRRYKLLALLLPIKHHLETLAKSKSSVDSLRIESPFPLSKDALSKIIELIGAKTETANVTINKDLLAGFKARYQGKLYDGSAERIIKQLL